MNKNKKGILIGLCLGDGYLSKPQHNCKSVSIELEQCEEQKDYLIYKAELLEKVLGGKKITIHSRVRVRINTLLTSFRCRKSDNYFRILRNILYKNEIKVFSDKILNKLNDHGVAIWIMDDGSLSIKKKDNKIKGCQFKLSTCTSIEQNEIIKKFFFKRYNVNLTICKHMTSKDGNVLYSLMCGTREYYKLALIIDKYIIPSMKYKTEILRFHECQTSL